MGCQATYGRDGAQQVANFASVAYSQRPLWMQVLNLRRQEGASLHVRLFCEAHRGAEGDFLGICELLSTQLCSGDVDRWFLLQKGQHRASVSGEIRIRVRLAGEKLPHPPLPLLREQGAALRLVVRIHAAWGLVPKPATALPGAWFVRAHFGEVFADSHDSHVCAGTGRTPLASAPGPGAPLSHPSRDSARALLAASGSSPKSDRPQPQPQPPARWDDECSFAYSAGSAATPLVLEVWDAMPRRPPRIRVPDEGTRLAYGCVGRLHLDPAVLACESLPPSANAEPMLRSLRPPAQTPSAESHAAAAELQVSWHWRVVVGSEEAATGTRASVLVQEAEVSVAKMAGGVRGLARQV